MSVIELKYFNSFIIKKLVDASDVAMWPGLPWGVGGLTWPTNAKTSGAQTATSSNYQWYLEESRIRGGYNNTEVGYGVRAYITETNDEEIVSSNSLIYSGVLNSLTSFNETNVFSIGESITKSVDPSYGSIQKLYTTDGNLLIMQEDKVSRALIDKSAIYSAQGDANVTSSDLVIGQIIPYGGEYGISKHPESFGIKGYRAYWADQSRGLMLRLSRDGITEISDYGLRDDFRDNLAAATSDYKVSDLQSFSVSGTGTQVSLTGSVALIELGMSVYGNYGGTTGAYVTDITITTPDTVADVTFSKSIGSGSGTMNLYKLVKGEIVGGYDEYSDVYMVSVQPAVTDLSLSDGTYTTATFNDANNGWTSYWDYKPNFIGSLNSSMYTCKDAGIWKHNDGTTLKNDLTFYGDLVDASVTFVFNNDPSISKNFNTVSYEGTNGWEIESFVSDQQGIDLNSSSIPQALNNYKDATTNVYSYEEGLYTQGGVKFRAGFDRKEGKYTANLVNNSSARVGEVNYGSSMSGIKGYYAIVKIKTDSSTDVGGRKQLFSVSSNNVISST